MDVAATRVTRVGSKRDCEASKAHDRTVGQVLTDESAARVNGGCVAGVPADQCDAGKAAYGARVHCKKERCVCEAERAAPALAACERRWLARECEWAAAGKAKSLWWSVSWRAGGIHVAGRRG